ncbi:hypothetical protein ACFCP7_00345 [Paenibacillus elgii]
MNILPVSLKKIKELEYVARTGNMDKKQALAVAKAKYESMKVSHFNKEFPYVEWPAQWYVDKLADHAKSGHSDAIIRYEMLKERREYMDRGIAGDDVKDFRENVQELHRIINSGVEITEDVFKVASHVALENSSPENLALYSAIKARRQAQKDGEYITSEAPPVERKITQEDVGAALEKAKRSSSPHDIATYATLKRQFESQEVTK